ncbi:MAG: leucine-rich repeat domain-containing protein [Clostridia bacterium]|nr:leucine-rich repeat domain-containing protein [Clostridia bacterium]
MKKTSKLIISLAVTLAVFATVLIVAVFKNDESKAAQPSVIYTLQPTVNTIPADTNAYVDINALYNNMVSDTDAAYTATTLFNGGVTVPGTGTSNVTQFIYVDQNGNVIDPNSIGTIVVTQGANNGGEVMDDAVIQDNSQANDNNVTLSEYEINSQGVITKYNGSSALVMIPEKINGVSVTGIGDRCFADSSIKSVYIPGYVTYIGNKAFENCLYLQSVNFVDMKARVTIGTAAFQNCPSLTTVHLPAAKLSDTVFGNCTALSSVSFAEGTEKIGMYCFSNCKALASVSIPESVNLENIGQDIFFGCDRGKLTVITPYGSDAETYAVNAGVTTREP